MICFNNINSDEEPLAETGTLYDTQTGNITISKNIINNGHVVPIYNGKKLAANKDFEFIVSYPSDITSAAKPANNFSYTGGPVQPYSMKITFKDKSISPVDVVLDKDATGFDSELYGKFDITFVNNTNKKTAAFSIVARNLKKLHVGKWFSKIILLC